MESYKYKSGTPVQENPKPSMLISCEDLDNGQKEVGQMIGGMTEQSSYNKVTGDLIGYTTLRLKVLQVAVQELLDAWKVNRDTDEHARLIQAVERLGDAMKQTAGRNLHA